MATDKMPATVADLLHHSRKVSRHVAEHRKAIAHAALQARIALEQAARDQGGKQ